MNKLQTVKILGNNFKSHRDIIFKYAVVFTEPYTIRATTGR